MRMFPGAATLVEEFHVDVGLFRVMCRLACTVGISNGDIRVHPTHELAQDKLLYAAPVTLTDSGNWQIAVTILSNGEWTHVTGTVDVAPARPMVTSYLELHRTSATGHRGFHCP